MTIVKRIKLIRKKRKKKRRGENHWLGETRLSIIVFPIKRFEQWQSRWIPSRILFPSGPCVWTIGKQQEPAATSKGRSTSRHSTRGTYDNHVTHFLHDNVTVEFHYWRIDWGIAGAANLSAAEHERRPSKKRWFTSYIRTIACKLMCTMHVFHFDSSSSIFTVSLLRFPHIILFNDWLFAVDSFHFATSFQRGIYRWEYYYLWIYAWIFER